MNTRFVKALFFFSILTLSQEVSALLQGNRILLVDDYNTQALYNRLGGENRGNFVTGKDAFKETGASLSLNYEMDDATPFAYFWTGLGKKDDAQGTNAVVNLSEMSYLSFWMKPEEESEGQALDCFIEIHEDTDGDKKFVLGPDVSGRAPVARFSGGEGEKQWRKIVIPLFHFRNVRHWDRILEIAFVLESKRGNKKGRLLIDNFLFGSHYPEEAKGREIPMQNRVSSFKIGNRIASSEMKLKRELTLLTLTLTFIDPYLEEIHFEQSVDGGGTWQLIQSFYDHTVGGVYSAEWEIDRDPKAGQGVLVRIMGMNVLGGETRLGGPYHISFN